MAVTLRKSQSTPALASTMKNLQAMGRQTSSSTPHIEAAEFSDTIARNTTKSGLVHHVDTLAQKITLEGMLMKEVSRLRDSWVSRGGGSKTKAARGGLSSGVAQYQEFASAIVAHAQISYVLQVSVNVRCYQNSLCALNRSG